MKKSFVSSLTLSVVALFVFALFQNCGIGFSTSTLTSTPSLSRAGGTTVDNPMVSMRLAFVSSQSTVDIGLCITGVTFFNAGSNRSVSTNFSQSIKIAKLSQTLTQFSETTIEPGSYDQTTVHLSASCTSSPAIEVRNTTGSYLSNESLNLIFNGAFNAGYIQNQSLFLNLDNYLSDFHLVRSDSEIPNVITTVTGSTNPPTANLGFSQAGCQGILVGAEFNAFYNSPNIRNGNSCYVVPAYASAPSGGQGALSLDGTYNEVYGNGIPVPLNVNPVSAGFTAGYFYALSLSGMSPDGVCRDYPEAQHSYVAVVPTACQ